MAKTADGTIVIDVKAKSDQYKKSLTQARKASIAFASGANAAMAAAATAVWKLNQRVADLRNALNDMSVRTGLSAKTLAGLKLAAEGSGQQLASLEGSLRGFPKRMADAAKGTGEARDAFHALDIGLTNADGSLRSADDVLAEFTKKIARVKDPTTKAALSTAAFGKSGTNLMVALGGEGLDKFVDKAESFGLDIGPEASKSANDWQRAQADLNLVMERTIGLVNDMVPLSKGVSNFTTGFVFLTEKIKNLASGMSATEAHTAAMSKTFEFFQSQQTQVAEKTEELIVDFKETAEGLKSIASASKEATSAERVRLQVLSEQAAATANLWSLTTELELALGDERDQIKADFADRMRQIAILENASQDFAEAEIARGQALQIKKRDLLALDIEDRQKAADQIMAIEAAIVESELAQADAIAVDRQARNQQRLSDSFAFADATIGVGQMILDATMAQQDLTTESGRQQARKQFYLQKGVSLANAAISTAAAVAGALANPPAPPYSIPQAIAAGAFGSAQIGIISAQQPSFHIGSRAGDLAPDEATITRRERMGVLTPQGIQAGGADAIARANAGLSDMGGPMILQLGGDFFDAAAKRAAKTGGAFSRSVRQRSKVGHRMVR
jgi:hypothetical protein